MRDFITNPGETGGDGPLLAILWDYDGTLVDTRHKNLNVTRAILRDTTGSDPTSFPALQSLAPYVRATERSANWRDFYRNEFGLDDVQIDEAGRKWTEFQLRDTTPVPLFDGISELLHKLEAVPHGIVSQNSRHAIERTLEYLRIRHYFKSIIGYEEVEIRRQKPEPDGILRCIEDITRADAGSVLYIGDHETDAVSAHKANLVLQNNKKKLRIRSIGAMYSNSGENTRWQHRPDYEAQGVQTILAIVESIRSMAAIRH